jgi:DNA sulfur modification protein DndB
MESPRQGRGTMTAKQPKRAYASSAAVAPAPAAATATASPPSLPSTAPRSSADTWALPAVRGVQARRAYFLVMVRLRELVRLFVPVDAKLPPELRAQRILTKVRVPVIAEYILKNPDDYTFGSLVGVVDGEPRFEPALPNANMGTLFIPRSTAVAMIDGQHRLAGIARALVSRRGGRDDRLGDESISVVLFVDTGLARAQQRFADLNRYGVRPNGSLGRVPAPRVCGEQRHYRALCAMGISHRLRPRSPHDGHPS